MTLIPSYSRCRFACALGVAALAWLSPVVIAQGQGLPGGLSSAAQLTSAQEQQIQQFVRSQFERLTSDDPAEVQDARRSLESPFTDRQPPTIAFRLSYGSQVAIELGPILRAEDTNMDAAVNALLIAGECGTPQTVELLGDVVAGKRGPGSLPIRTAAVAALHNVIREADAGNIRRDQGEQAVSAVAQALAKAENAAFASACIIALDSTERQPLHGVAAEQLSAALPTLADALRNMPKVEDPVRWEQSMQLGLRLIQVYIQAGGAQRDQALAKSAVASGAQALGFVVTRVKSVGPEKLGDDAERASLVGLTDQAEKLMQLASPGATGFPAGLAGKLGEAIERGDAQVFIDAARAAGRWAQRITGQTADEYGL